MQDYPAFLVLIKTNYDKLIGMFVDSKYEDLREMEFEIDGKKDKGGKLINNLVIFYVI